tara:strand:- start:768 stop:1256 length:489 start_codon:yes stop_codon:yes gene_type:complete
MLLKTSRFGEIEIHEDQIITMPSGLIGFSEDRRFVIREDEAAKPFLWLQSVDNDALAFVMIEPHFSFSNYELELTKETLKKLKAEKTEDLSVFVLVTMAKSMEDVTVNLQGPLLFNPEKKIGLQFIIPEGKYSTRHSLFGEKIKNNSTSNLTEDISVNEKVL